jgi:hypothetical protein
MLVDDEHYEIEKILDKRVRNGVTECLIRWKGYTEEYDTWEPEQNLCDTACESYVYFYSMKMYLDIFDTFISIPQTRRPSSSREIMN